MNIDIEEQYDKVYRYCYFKLHNREKAEDITQETFLRYLESSNYKDTGRPLAFLYTVARNLCIDEYRKKQFETLSEDIEDNYNEDNMLDSISIRIAMQELTEREKELVLLRHVNEVPVSTLAKMFGISRFALYRELKNILRKLERRISDGPENEAGIKSIL